VSNLHKAMGKHSLREDSSLKGLLHDICQQALIGQDGLAAAAAQVSVGCKSVATWLGALLKQQKWACEDVKV
jgi:hypothetical protein